MVKPYSQDLRLRVIAAVEEDALSCREAARRYRVSPSSAVKWLQAYRRTGRQKARPMGGDRRSVLKPHAAWLARLIAREDDLTLMAIATRLLAERGIKADAIIELAEHAAKEPWPLPERRTSPRQSALRSMANSHLPGGPAP